MSRWQRLGGDATAFLFFMAIFAMVGLICIPSTPSSHELQPRTR
jgi:hypothetical protein